MPRGVRTWVVEVTRDVGSKILEGLEGWVLRYSEVDTGPFLAAGVRSHPPRAAWNDTDGVRVVMFMDVLRPLRGPGGWASRGLIKAIGFSPFVRDGKARHRNWKRRFEGLQNRL